MAVCKPNTSGIPLPFDLPYSRVASHWALTMFSRIGAPGRYKTEQRVAASSQRFFFFFFWVPRKVVFSRASPRSPRSCSLSCLSPSTWTQAQGNKPKIENDGCHHPCSRRGWAACRTKFAGMDGAVGRALELSSPGFQA